MKSNFNKNKHGAGIYIALMAAPLTAGLLYSLAYSLGLTGLLSKGFTWEHWAHVIQNPETWSSLLFSLAMALFVALSSAALALGVVLLWGDLLERRFPERMLYLALTIPPLVAAFISFQWLGKSGMVVRLLMALGLVSGIDSAPEWINDRFQIGVILTLVALTAPFFTILLLQYRRAENLPELANTARTLGATERQIVRRIFIPALVRRALPNFGLSAIFLFGAYEVPLLLGRQSPRMISVLIAQKFRRFDLNDIPQAYVLTILYALVVGAGAWMVFQYAKTLKK